MGKDRTESIQMPDVLYAWQTYLQTAGAAFGMMLCLTGLSLMLVGWRFDRFALVGTCAILGFIAGPIVAAERFSYILSAALGATAFAATAGVMHQYVGPVLAGFTGSVALWAFIGDTAMPSSTMYIILILAFVAIAAPAMSGIAMTTVIITSCIGSALFVSGLIAMVVQSNALAPHFNTMTTYGIFYPFLLLVPTVTGIFLQSSAVRRKDCGDVTL